jgi:ribosomal protein L31
LTKGDRGILEKDQSEKILKFRITAGEKDLSLEVVSKSHPTPHPPKVYPSA